MAGSATNDAAKPLILTDNDTGDKYTLEFSRESVKFAEARGFDVEDVGKYPMTKVPDLFFYAFRKNHRGVPRERTDRMLFDDLKGLSPAAIERLLALYTAPFEALVVAEDDGGEKNARMTVEL